MAKPFRAHARRRLSEEPLLDVRPDDVDGRDYLFAPSLQLVPEISDPRQAFRPVILDQRSEGACVGFGLAAVINLSLRRRAAATRRSRGQVSPVSPRMLYEMGRRYDEWQGENAAGTSLRGGMKGWHRHGVCSERSWPYRPGGRPGRLTPERATDALTRPLGAYFRILDSDVGHLQAAIVEGDAVLASAWVHSGWRSDQLEPPRRSDPLRLKSIPRRSDLRGLHAFALIGYGPEGFLVQNSWGAAWGSGGLAVLSYDDWFDNRQDAWVARPGPQTWDSERSPRIFVVGFAGGTGGGAGGRAGTTGAEGLEIPSEALSYLINTGDRGALSDDGRLETRPADLPAMADLVRQTSPRNGRRDVLLYAHGGLVSQTEGAQVAARLWGLCRERDLTAYFFVWETGFFDSALGWMRSRDDARGPRAEVNLGALLRRAGRGLRDAWRATQRKVGATLAPLIRPAWREMHARAEGASAPRGGASLFVNSLFAAMSSTGPSPPFRLHLMGHSAGAIFMAWLYDRCLRDRLAASSSVGLGSIRFMAPALSVGLARSTFAPAGRLPVPSSRFTVSTLSEEDEEHDSIGAYPSSLLTYVKDELESAGRRVPLLGIGTDLEEARARLGRPTHLPATLSTRHGEFDDLGHEVDQTIDLIASGRER